MQTKIYISEAMGSAYRYIDGVLNYAPMYIDNTFQINEFFPVEEIDAAEKAKIDNILL